MKLHYQTTEIRKYERKREIRGMRGISFINGICRGVKKWFKLGKKPQYLVIS